MAVRILGFVLVAFLLFVSVAYGLSYWAFRAETDRSAFVGLYLIYGFPGVLLTVAGVALAFYGRDNGLAFLGIGLGLTLPLIKPFRRLAARVTPIDPGSPVDMSGLCLVLAVVFFLAVTTILQPDPTTTTQSVSNSYLILQVAAFVALAYTIVGTGFRRTFAEATKRLGLARPSVRTVAIAVGFVLLALVVSAMASGLTAIAQPQISDEIQRGLKDMTSDVQNPVGAVILGLSAGIGEELLFRGALQPRLGIVLTATFFALLHTQYGFSFVTLGIFGIGVLLGIERKRFGTMTSITTHAIFNTIAVLIQTYR